jgi:hypothetical protein
VSIRKRNLIDAVLWRALPYRDPTRLMVLLTSSAAGQANASLPDFTSIRERVRSRFASGTPAPSLTIEDGPRQVSAQRLK